MSSGQFTVCIVGAGPRGLSVLERICANERKSASHPAVTVHVVEPHRPGPGRVWRTGQSRLLLMNTVASQVTVYTDDSVEMAGPIEPGPSLWEWARAAASTPGLPPQARAEAARLGPDDYPTRSFYGHYLRHVFDQVVAAAPPHVTVRVHRARAVALEEAAPGAAQVLTLSDGALLSGLDAVVLAQGHVPAQPAPWERETARAARDLGLRHVLPANPADVDLSDVRPGQSVLLRGLGLNFFDHMALFTAGRGGTFTREGGRLTYRPSGREPRLYAGSRRGIPYHARGENEKGPHGRHVPKLLTEEYAAGLRRRGGVSFGRDLWPLIAREVEAVYYGALLTERGRGAERAAFTDRCLACPPGPRQNALLTAYGVEEAVRWDWERLSRPYGEREFADRADFHRWLLPYLEQDVRQARAGNVSGPVKAALDVLRDLRNEIRLAVDHGGLDGNSHRDDLEGWYTPLNAFLSIGPPASRIEEMTALIEAGVLELVGPDLDVRVDSAGPAFVARSGRVGGAPVRASVLVEARLPEPDLRRTADPLLARLLASGQCRPYRIPGRGGTGHETGGLAVTARPYRLVDAAGRAHPRRFACGVPTEHVHWVTAAGIRPGVNSVTLGDSDAIARAALGLAPATVPGPLRPADDLTEAPA